MALTVRVVSPESMVFEGEAASIVAPAWDGRVGILPGHAPFISLLGAGALAIDLPGGGSENYFVAGGVVSVDQDKVTLLTEYAGETPPDVLPPEATLAVEDDLVQG